MGGQTSARALLAGIAQPRKKRRATNRRRRETPHNGQWLPAREAAKNCGLGFSTLAKLRLTGGGAGLGKKVGSKVLYNRNHLDKWLAKQARSPALRKVGRAYSTGANTHLPSDIRVILVVFARFNPIDARATHGVVTPAAVSLPDQVTAAISGWLNPRGLALLPADGSGALQHSFCSAVCSGVPRLGWRSLLPNSPGAASNFLQLETRS